MKTKFILLYVFPRKAFLCLALCLFIPEVFGQTDDAKKFEVVPSATRQRLIERLNRLIEYERSGQREKRYELFNEPLIKRVGTKADYLKKFNDSKIKDARGDLLAFDISGVSHLVRDSSDPGYFMIEGVIKVRLGKKIRVKERHIIANYQKGDWYFGDWNPTTICEFCEGRPQTPAEIKARLERLYTALNDDPKAQGLIIFHGNDKEVAADQAAIRKAIRLGRFDEKRVKLALGDNELPRGNISYLINAETKTNLPPHSF